MANQGQPNASGGGVQTSSTARQSGKGSMNAETGFIHGSTVMHPDGGDSDPMGSPADLFEVNGELSITKPV